MHMHVPLLWCCFACGCWQRRLTLGVLYYFAVPKTAPPMPCHLLGCAAPTHAATPSRTILRCRRRQRLGQRGTAPTEECWASFMLPTVKSPAFESAAGSCADCPPPSPPPPCRLLWPLHLHLRRGGVTCYMLHAKCYMLHVICYMLYVTCFM